MAIIQPIVDLAAVCYEHGIRNVVISPGSRSAALTLAFTRHGGVDIRVVMDERAAGFIALGMALQTRVPVVVICTSGSAAYNLAPSVSEAFFQQIPLIVLTADRPREWIHQMDGQTIYQSEIFGKHVKKSADLLPDYDHPDTAWFVNRTVNDAILTAGKEPMGPVQINVPIREPFYPDTDEQFVVSPNLRIIRRPKTEMVLSEATQIELFEEFCQSKKILIVGGQYCNSSNLCSSLSRICDELNVPVVGDVISNQIGNEHFISAHDIFLPVSDKDELRPDLLITYGLSLVSKELKAFLRKNPPKVHWHISESDHIVDTFGSLRQQILTSPQYFFEKLLNYVDYKCFNKVADLGIDANYGTLWQTNNRKATMHLEKYLRNLTSINDLSLIDFAFLYLKSKKEIHIANSMPIRYANVLRVHLRDQIVFANRGTSGIDGCVSTAIGASLVSDSGTLLVTGDVAFLYDRNGLLINGLPSNLKIVVLNNSGGNIFGMIDGPARQPEQRAYFQSAHSFSAQRTAADSGIFYASISKPEDVEPAFKAFFDYPGISLLEVFSDPEENVKVWKGLKRFVLENW